MAEGSTAERIAAAATRILVDEGAPAVTMRRVAADAGVSTMATYRHFPNREELLRVVADEAFATLGADWGKQASGADFDSQLFGLLDDFLDFATGQPNLYTFLMTDRREQARQFPEDFRSGASPAFAPVVAVVEAGMRGGQLRRDDPLEVSVAITAQTMGLVDLYLGGRIGLSESKFRALCKRSARRLFDGLR